MFGRWFGGGGAGGQYERGLAALRRGDYETALSAFDALLARRAENAALVELAHFYRAESLGHLGRHALLQGDDLTAIAHLDAALAVSPSYPDLRLLRGVARLRQGDAPGALEDARDALESNPRFLEAHMLLAAAHVELSESQLSMRAWGQALPLAADRDAALRAALRASGPPPRAELIELLLGESRRREEIQRSRTLLAQGYWQRARADFQRYVEEQPRYPDLRFSLALAAFQVGEFELARQQLSAALSLQPGYAEAALLLAILELRQERVAQAAQLFEIGAKSTAASGVAAYGLAVCAFLSGDCTQAQLRSLPEDFGGTHWLRLAFALEGAEARSARLELAALRCDDVEDALDLQLAADSLGEVPPPAALELLPAGAAHAAVALLRARSLAKPERRVALEQALAQHPGSAALLRALATLEAETGATDAALRRLEQLGPARSAEAQLADISIWRLAGRDELLLAAPPAPALAVLVARLQALRRAGQAESALALRTQLVHETPLELKLRLQDPARWTRPLLRWPASSAAQESGLLSLQA